MEEILDNTRSETTFILYCSTIGSYVRGFDEGIVTFNSFYPKEFPDLESALEARAFCRNVFRQIECKGYRLSIRRREYRWRPCGNTPLMETPVKLQ